MLVGEGRTVVENVDLIYTRIPPPWRFRSRR